MTQWRDIHQLLDAPTRLWQRHVKVLEGLGRYALTF
jgi:hypothetical protein